MGGGTAYLAACALLASLLGVQTVHHRWGADAWHHAAVVRTLAEDSRSPDHPVLPVAAPHQFIVPPAFVAAAVAAWTGAEALDGLAVLAGLNLGLLLTGIWWLVRTLCPASRWTPVLTLGLSLFLWGPNPWGYSGFLHLNQIGQSLPYPSSFAFGAALLALAAYGRWIVAGGFLRLVAGVVLAPLVVLSHPVASMLLCAGMAGLLVRHVGSRAAWIGAVTMGTASLIAAVAWPYYPFLSLIAETGTFDASNRALYEGVLLRTLPLWPGLAVVWARLGRDRRDPLGLSILALGALYGAGFVLERWSLGRVMSPLAFLLQVALADWLSDRWAALRGWLSPSRGRLALASTGAAALLGLALANMAPGLARTLPPPLLPAAVREDPRLDPMDRRHSFLRDWIEYGDVVLARPGTGWPVPAYGGKILAPSHPQAFIDTGPMQADVESFFAEETGPAVRHAIARRHSARWVLLDTRRPEEAEVLPRLRLIARVAGENRGLVLLEIAGPAGPTSPGQPRP